MQVCEPAWTLGFGGALKWSLRLSVYSDNSICISNHPNKTQIYTRGRPISLLKIKSKVCDVHLFLRLGADTRGRCRTTFSNNNCSIMSPTPEGFNVFCQNIMHNAPITSNYTNVGNLHAMTSFYSVKNFMEVMGARGRLLREKIVPVYSYCCESTRMSCHVELVKDNDCADELVMVNHNIQNPKLWWETKTGNFEVEKKAREEKSRTHLNHSIFSSSLYENELVIFIV